MASKQTHSIEEIVEQWAKEKLNGIKLYAKNDFINTQIERAQIPVFWHKTVQGFSLVQELALWHKTHDTRYNYKRDTEDLY